MNADKMKTPLLLIHGKADNNSGTYTMQSERYFNALKGLGATVRLVVLPKKSWLCYERTHFAHVAGTRSMVREICEKSQDEYRNY